MSETENTGYNPNRDSGIALDRAFVQVPSTVIADGISEYGFVPEQNKRYFAKLVHMVDIAGGENTLGYNPNRDSGIAEMRGYVEVDKVQLQKSGLISTTNPIDPTQRYFAQVVYNVGGASSGPVGGNTTSGGLTDEERALLQSVNNYLTNINDNGLPLYVKDIKISGDIQSPVSAEVSALIYQDIADVTPELSRLNETVYAMDIGGYVTAVENYVQLGTNDNGQTIWSTHPDRWLPSMNYYDKTELATNTKFVYLNSEKTSADYKFGLTRIYFTEAEYESLLTIPTEKAIIRVYYLNVNVQNPS